MKTIKILILMSFTFLNAGIECEKNVCEVSQDMTFWGVDLYHFTYVISKEGSEKIILTYKRDIEREKNVEKTIEKFSANNEYTKECEKVLNEWNSHLIDVKDGTIYEVEVDDNGTKMFIDKKKVYELDNGIFGKKYIKIWSGEKPVDEDLKKKIDLAKNKLNFK